MKIKNFLLATGVVLVTVFCFSCSELKAIFKDDGDEDDEISSSSSSSGGDNTLSSSSVPAPDAGSLTDSRDSQTYRTVQIGSQTWMAENLNYNAAGSKCYNNIASNCNTYGRLYNWSVAMNFNASCNESDCIGQINTPHKGICPSGWHIPSNAEWSVLIAAVGGENIAGAELKAGSGWKSNGNGTDGYGFSALPGGTCMSILSFMDYFDLVGDYGYWWTADESYGPYALFRSISYNEDGIGLFDLDKPAMMSVRCVKDSAP